MAYVQNTDNNGLVVAQCEDVAGTGFTNVKASANNSMYVSLQETSATLEVGVKGTNAHDAADTTDAPVKLGAHANAAEPAAVSENDMANVSVDLYGNQKVVGNVAADAADRGCPIKVGGIANAAAPTPDEGDRGDLSMDLNSQVRVVADSVTAAAGAAFPSAMLCVGFRGNAAKPTAEDEGDIIAPSVDLQGQMRVIIPDCSAALDAAVPGSAVLLGGKGNAAAPTADDEGDILALSVDLQGSQRMIGNLAHSAVDAGEPVKTGSKAVDITALPANVTALDRADDISDLKGRKIVTMDEVMGTATAAIPAKGIIIQGSDGTNAYAIKVDTSGNVQVEALATPYDATVAAAVPSVGAAMAISDGTNARLLKGDTAGVPFIQGEIAHDAADSGNPIKTGGKATAALPAAVTEGDRVQASYDLYGQKRIMKQERAITLHAAGAVTESANDTTVTGIGPYTHAEFLFNLTVADTDAGDTLDVFVDASPDGGTTWVNVIHFIQKIGTDAAAKYVAAIHSAANLTEVDVTSDLAASAAPRSFLGNALRCRYAIVDAGTDDASFNFTLTAVLKQS